MEAGKLTRSNASLSIAARSGAASAKHSTDKKSGSNAPAAAEPTTEQRLLNQPDLRTRLFGADSGSADGNRSGSSGFEINGNTVLAENRVNNVQLDNLVNTPSLDLAARIGQSVGQSIGLTAAQATIESDSSADVDEIVEEVLAEDNILYRPELLASRIEDLDADTQAEVISQILQQSDNALTDITSPIAVTQWLSPSYLNDLHEHEGLLSSDGQRTLANAYAAAWNRDLIPEGIGFGGVEGSMLDNVGVGRESAAFAEFFNAGNTSEVREFRSSYAQHLNDTYVQPLQGAPGEANQIADNAALLASRLVTDPGVPQRVAIDFYEQTFGNGSQSEFVDFLESAVEARNDNEFYTNENEGYDPFVAFAKIAQVPSTYDVHFDNSNNGTREQIGIDLAFAVGQAETSGGNFGFSTEYGGVLAGSEELRLERLNSAVDVFEDHGTAILDQLSAYSDITFNSAAGLNRAHPELVGFFRHTIGNTDLENREAARDVATDYFDRQIQVINENTNPGDPETEAERRATAIGAAAGLATQDIRADQQAVADARRSALEFGVDSVLSLIPFGKGATAVRNELTEAFGTSIGANLIGELTEELINSGTGKLSTASKNRLLDALIRQGGGAGTVATGQEFINLTVNPLGRALAIEDGVIPQDIIPGHVEEAYQRIIANTKTTIGLDN